MSFFKVVLFSCGLPSSVKTSVVAKIFPAARYFAVKIGRGCSEAATLGASPLDDPNGVFGRQLRFRVQHNIFMGRHFVVFDDRRDGREKHPLIGFLRDHPNAKD